MAEEFVPKTTIDYDEVLRRGGQNCGNEDFALFKCPLCGQVYLIEYEVDTVYLSGRDLSLRASVSDQSFVTARLTRQPEKRALSGATRISVAKFVGGEVRWSGAGSASDHFPGEQDLAAA